MRITHATDDYDEYERRLWGPTKQATKLDILYAQVFVVSMAISAFLWRLM